MTHSDEIRLLKELFVPEAQAAIVEQNGNQAVILKESGKDAVLKHITITHLGETPFILLPEAGQGKDRRYSPLFSKQEGCAYHQACDAVIFYKRGDTLFEIYMDMKSQRTSGCEKQFQATEDFIGYAWKVLETQHGHQRLKRTRRKIVLNTKRNDHSLQSKLATHPKHFPKDGITYIKVKDRAVLTPADILC